jgi:hypothetical protein
MLALKSVQILEDIHKGYEKTFSAKIRLFDHWLGLTEEQRQASLGKDLESFIADIVKLGLPMAAADIKGLVTAFFA